LSNLQNLTIFKLEFSKTEVSDLGLTTLSKALLSCKRLMTLRLALWVLSGSGHITDNGMAQLSSAISNLHNLTSIKLNFRGNKNITDTSLRYLAEGLSKLKNWTSFGESNLSLDLDFVDTQATQTAQRELYRTAYRITSENKRIKREMEIFGKSCQTF